MSSSSKQRAQALFLSHFNFPATTLAVAPARVNLIGGHTDYNEGYVLPVAINLHTTIAFKPREDGLFRAISEMQAEPIEWDIEGLTNNNLGKYHWGDYLKGVVSSFKDAGLPINGLDMAVVSNIPSGSGLASSAALEIGFALALSHSSRCTLSSIAIAQLCQRGENQYVGFECGIMDQVTCASAVKDHALLIDCMDLDPTPIELNPNWELLIIQPEDTVVRHPDDYAARQAECELITQHFGIDSLRELSLAELSQARQSLGETLYRRAHHVISENLRVYRASRALMRNQLSEFSSIMSAAHASMRDDFELSNPEIDNIINVVSSALEEKVAIRITGGGLGGCAVALTEKGGAQAIVELLKDSYQKQDKVPPQFYLCSADDGARLITID